MLTQHNPIVPNGFDPHAYGVSWLVGSAPSAISTRKQPVTRRICPLPFVRSCRF